MFMFSVWPGIGVGVLLPGHGGGSSEEPTMETSSVAKGSNLVT